MNTPTRTPETLRTIRNLLSGRKLAKRDHALLNSFLCSADAATPLRLAVAACGTGCGMGTARHARWLLGVLGFEVEARGIFAVWASAYDRLDRGGAWIDPTELSRRAREAAGYEAKEAWRRATCDAFDAARRNPMTQDEKAHAWSFVSARVAALHLLGVEVGEVSDLVSVVRGWLPEEARGALAA